MADERMDLRTDMLIRRLDLDASPDVAFADATLAVLAPRVRAARNRDRHIIGRLLRNTQTALEGAAGRTLPRPVLLLGVVLLLLLALLAAVAIGSAIERLHPRNGPLIASINGKLEVIDTTTGASRTIGDSGQRALGVSRSPDGRLLAYWTDSTGISSDLHVLNVADGQARSIREQTPVRWANNTIDTWSPDSRWLASEVSVIGHLSILVTNVETGAGTLIGPATVSAHAPLWSPDGQWIAFFQDTMPRHSLAVMRPDGSRIRTISGDLGGFDAAGANNWSPDGKWVYYVATQGTRGRLFRADFTSGTSGALTGDSLVAFAPALSPDGANLSFIVPVPNGDWDLYVANSDGTGPHRVLPNAMNLGWSSDGRDILAQWTPKDRLGGLALIHPDGTDLRVVYPFDTACQAAVAKCVIAVGWGQPRP